jgi:hypothetical protein
MEKTIRVEFISANEKKTFGNVRARYFDKGERSERALKVFGLSWGIGIFCIIIPLAHFILVPGFLLAGPVVAYFFYKQTDIVLDSSGPCPSCEKPFKVARTRVQWPISDVCSECHNSVKIFPVNPV